LFLEKANRLKKIRIGGVPEHFNLPWHLAIENHHFEKEGIEIEWIDFPGGTGAMNKALRAGEIDVCLLLTEGIISDIINGNPSKIIAMYVNTPLIWGIHTYFDNPIERYGETYNKNYSISRYGSGSHLIPIVDATMNNKKINKNQFVEIKDLEGAIASLRNGETDVFYWEKYTTKPLVDNGTFRRIGEFVTPWSCFAIAATDSIIEKESDTLKKILSIIHFNCEQFMNSPIAIELVSNRYNQQIEDVEQWFYSTEWATNDTVSTKMLKNVMFMLKQAGIIEEFVPLENILKKL
jgi:sulfonate transport system substrate-binding protein